MYSGRGLDLSSASTRPFNDRVSVGYVPNELLDFRFQR